MATETHTFHAADYVVFALSLVACSGIGVVYGYVGMRKKKSAKEQMTGGKEMGVFPVSLSILASFQAAPFVLGTPAEMYAFGTQYCVLLIACVFALPVVAHVIIPVLHRLDIMNGYQYFEMRFNKATRRCASFIFCWMIILYQAVTVYAPALAFSQVTGLSQDISILGVGIIATFYTAIGGLAAVIWIDVLQMFIILAGLIVMAILGAVEVGGWNKVIDTANDGGRIEFGNFDPDPTVRTSFWSPTIGGAFIVLSVLGSSQASIQKYLSIGDLKSAQKTPYLVGVFYAVYLFLVCFLGLVMYTHYFGCDPLMTRPPRVDQPDQLILLFLMDVVGHLHGIPGLFTSAVFCASLSTVSAGINALAAVTMLDFVLPVYRHYKKPTAETTEGVGLPINEKLALIVSKSLTVFYGLLTIGFAYLAPLLGDTLLQMAFAVFGTLGGPLLAIMLLGMLVPFVNSAGALSGLAVSLIMNFWICIGAITTDSITMQGRKYMKCLSGLANCPAPPGVPPDSNDTVTSSLMMLMSTMEDITDGGGDGGGRPCPRPPYEDNNALWLYKISYMWYALIGVLVCFLVAIPVSLLTGGRQQAVDPKLLAFSCKFCQNEVTSLDVEKMADKDEKVVITKVSFDTKNENGLVNPSFQDVEESSMKL